MIENTGPGRRAGRRQEKTLRSARKHRRATPPIWPRPWTSSGASTNSRTAWPALHDTETETRGDGRSPLADLTDEDLERFTNDDLDTLTDDELDTVSARLRAKYEREGAESAALDDQRGTLRHDR